MDNEDQNSSFAFSDASVRADITKNNQLVSPFLKLPAEIRNAIYKLACADDIIMVRRCEPKSNRGACALLHTCRQIRFELLPIFYRHATFCLEQLAPGAIESGFYPFTGTSIKSVVLYDDFEWKQDVRDFGQLMPNVERIYVQLNGWDWRLRQCFSTIVLEMQEQKTCWMTARFQYVEIRGAGFLGSLKSPNPVNDSDEEG